MILGAQCESNLIFWAGELRSANPLDRNRKLSCTESDKNNRYNCCSIANMPPRAGDFFARETGVTFALTGYLLTSHVDRYSIFALYTEAETFALFSFSFSCYFFICKYVKKCLEWKLFSSSSSAILAGNSFCATLLVFEISHFEGPYSVKKAENGGHHAVCYSWLLYLKIYQNLV